MGIAEDMDRAIDIQISTSVGPQTTTGTAGRIAVESRHAGGISDGLLAQALNLVDESVYVVDGSSLRVLASNRAARDVVGMDAEKLRGMWLPDLFSPADRGPLVRSVTDAPQKSRATFLSANQLDGRCRSFPVELAIDASQEGDRVLVSVRDVSDRHRADALSRTPKFRDPLTGLPDRRAFVEQFETTLRRSRRTKERFALLFIDLDNFREVNERYGHVVGDNVLRVVARRFQKEIRKEDFVARFGGDEFVVLIRQFRDEETLRAIAARIESSLGSCLECGDVNLIISASFGLAHDLQECGGKESSAMHDMIAFADRRMYAAKRIDKSSRRV
ncbi:MAG: sensor domain-containing diguanylate cyclase [Planctomycetota bacterium]|nr:MAG: sensor domain-containing diguanylate cyclase [Planctomycetota bacterium]REK46599.1 MAG: sensor domain-containing diguanylate cyclase [Planctomycetota bacterium]